MAENTKIQWCDATFNPWRGCEKISPGCANCYAEAGSLINPEVLGEWGPKGRIAIAAESYWKKPLAWNRAAAKAGERRKVFCASYSDVFLDRPEVDRPLARLLKTIHLTPNLDWLLLTKRPELFGQRMDAAAICAAKTLDEGDGAELAAQWRNGSAMPNVWMGVSVENQEATCRLTHLADIPARVKFVSAEPLLGRLVLSGSLEGKVYHWLDPVHPRAVHWVIVGGESGPRSRACHLDCMRGIVRQCKEAEVPVFVKQLGSNPINSQELGPTELRVEDGDSRYRLAIKGGISIQETLALIDRKGGNPDEWPEDLRIREFPMPRRW